MSKKTVKRNDPSLAVVYIRVSTDDQKLGPEAQLEACRRHAAACSMTIVGVYEDLGVSGSTNMMDCPALTEALDAVADTKAGVLLIAKRDRLGRDMMKIAMVTQRVEALGARIHSADGVPESDEPTAVLMRRMVDAFAEFELALIRARTKAALRVKKVKGERVGRLPLGHRVVGNKVIVDAPKMQQLRQVQQYARDLYQQGLTLQAIAKRFIAEGVQYANYNWQYTMHVHRVLNYDLSDRSVGVVSDRSVGLESDRSVGVAVDTESASEV